jgi:carboxylate-amine ligase
VIEAHFGESAPFSIGVEEELMVLNADTLMLAPRAAELIAAAEGSGLPGTLKGELFASALELNTGICESPDEAAEALVELCAGAA